MITVRELGPDDWRLWRTLRLNALGSDPTAFGASYEEWVDAPEARWRHRLAAVATFLFEDGGFPAAVASLTYDPHTGPELISFWVDPAVRRQGIGAFAVRWIRDRAAQDYPGMVLTLGVAAHNHAAQRLYTRLGFVIVGVSPDDPTELRMVLHQTEQNR